MAAPGATYVRRKSTNRGGNRVWENPNFINKAA